jgi:hypothetical protein
VAVYVAVLVNEAVEVEEYDRLGDNDAVPVLVKDAVEVGDGEGRTALFVKDGELVNV